MAYQLQAFKSTTITSTILSTDTTGATFTLATAAFGSPTGTQILTIDPTSASREIITCTIVGTTVTIVSRAVDSTTAVEHLSGVTIILAFVPAHWNSLTSITTDTDAATVTFDLSLTEKHRVTLGGNRTFAVTNATAGQSFAIRILQDGTGSRTVTWFSGISWAGGSPPTLTTTANKADWIGFIATSSTTFDAAPIMQNV